MTKRKALSKKVRFEVFKRDSFTCQYCGNTPPLVILEIDHVDPVSKGGDNDIDNLVASCFDCNRGKGAIGLEQVPVNLIEKAELIREREDQLKAFSNLKKAVKARKTRDINKIEKTLKTFYPDCFFT